MPLTGPHAAQAHAKLQSIISACRAAGLTTGSVRPIDYGEQVTVSGGGATATDGGEETGVCGAIDAGGLCETGFFGGVRGGGDGCAGVGCRGVTVRTVDFPSSRVAATAMPIPAASNTTTAPITSARERRRRTGAVSGTTTMSSPSKCSCVTGSATECSGPPVVVTSSPWRPPTP